MIWIVIYGKSEEKSTFWAKFEHLYLYRSELVPVQVVFCFSILTSVCILTITCSFMIRFECFKFLVKINFKENKHPEIDTF